ncbi:MAG: NlpC/P60 family protein [Ferruginibacter sp.]
MKHLFFVAVAGGIFSGTTISVKAQTSANIERFAGKAPPKISLKFIEGIEIVAKAGTNSMVVIEEKVKSNHSPGRISPPVKSGFNQTIELCSSLQFKYGTMMDKEVESITNFPLYNFINDWWATHYRLGGTDRSGIDCSAFTGKLLCEVYGLTVPRTARKQFDICERLATADLIEGDLVFFNTRGGVSHVGLYLGNNYFVHSSVHDGITISSLEDEYYSRRFISGGRIMRSPASNDELFNGAAF